MYVTFAPTDLKALEEPTLSLSHFASCRTIALKVGGEMT